MLRLLPFVYGFQPPPAVEAGGRRCWGGRIRRRAGPVRSAGPGASLKRRPKPGRSATSRLILPFGAGSATDAAARLLGERLSARWGQAVVVENRPGGDGLIAIGAFVSAADDHVLLYASSATFIAHPYVHDKLPYKLETDLQPIARVSHTVLSIAVASATAFKTLADFVAGARAEPDKYNVAGAAGLPEFTLDAFVKPQNLKVTKVPYRDIVQAGAISVKIASSSWCLPMPSCGRWSRPARCASSRSAAVSAAPFCRMCPPSSRPVTPNS